MTADRDLERLIDIVASGIRILRTRDGVPVTDAQCLERARNIVSAVVVTFELRALPAIPEFRGDRNAPEGSWVGVSGLSGEPAPLPPPMTVKQWARLDFDTPLIEGRPVGHTWSCQCTKCHTFKQTRRGS